jgi:hypothetical protein
MGHWTYKTHTTHKTHFSTWSLWLSRLCWLLFFFSLSAFAEDRPWPTLPLENASAELPAQEWPYKSGPRTITAYVYYPGGALANVNAETGLFLSLHNWGGTNAIGAPDPLVLAERYDVVAICVDYLQSGKYDVATQPPYDFGYLQALDALRALYWVRQGLKEGGHAFYDGRTYAAGGSGGGNVSLMANKLAPRTFAAIVDCSGMAKLSYDIAFGRPGGSYLDAGYSRNRRSPEFLSRDARDLRDIGLPSHLAQMVALGNEARIFVAHGGRDKMCPTADKRRLVRKMARAGLKVDARFIGEKDLDGEVFTDTGHSVGDRTKILQHVADAALLPGSPDAAVRKGASDFERREVIRYETKNGRWEIYFAAGYPVGRFVAGGK